MLLLKYLLMNDFGNLKIILLRLGLLVWSFVN